MLIDDFEEQTSMQHRLYLNRVHSYRTLEVTVLHTAPVAALCTSPRLPGCVRGLVLSRGEGADSPIETQD